MPTDTETEKGNKQDLDATDDSIQVVRRMSRAYVSQNLTLYDETWKERMEMVEASKPPALQSAAADCKTT